MEPTLPAPVSNDNEIVHGSTELVDFIDWFARACMAIQTIALVLIAIALIAD